MDSYKTGGGGGGGDFDAVVGASLLLLLLLLVEHNIHETKSNRRRANNVLIGLQNLRWYGWFFVCLCTVLGRGGSRSVRLCGGCVCSSMHFTLFNKA